MAYKSTQELRAWMDRIASSSCRPRHDFKDNVRQGDLTKEAFDPWIPTPKERHELMIAKTVIINERKKVHNSERGQLFRMEKEIDKILRAGKMKVHHKMSFSQAFMMAAEQMLNEDVFQEIRERTHGLYHANDNLTPSEG